MSTKLTLQSTYPLGDGVDMPVLGFGVYNSPADVTQKSVTTALNTGYRHIDSAQYYNNEKEVGDAVRAWCRESHASRRQVFVTTKIIAPKSTQEETLASLRKSVNNVNLDGYVDCFLIHTPTSGPSGRAHLWSALKQLQSEGKTVVIGVSNYGVKHLVELIEKGEKPAVNQIELHPWCQQRPIVEFCKKHDIVLQAYCPIVRGEHKDDKEVNKIADKHKVDWSQVLLRWSLQKGFVPLPKSDTPSRIASNADLYSFELDEEDIKVLDAKDQGAKGAVAPNPVDCE
ncbi:related to 2,5-diketo-D-gluconic acid reductase [Melanopsichium pennsylvanicum]|uniref:Related to 2,5-diketo-D-gluconic acid reductase n=2 Tax=Melanopsichium pennsylvanicum TaxID=63383 RepID=A0AAJ5C806_9BASI|nr:related to 2,5-diketo-D-gluconic acid reductase [Melanopsichium pennsylvanicum 4]SNX87497.1 related to 2,5-diketo-D-gluconic acid reductase [Melanopsichium pennsylvanicum]